MLNERYYQPIPCGETLPLDNPHAFSVSMPTIQDVIDYEEETEEIFTKIRSAYPRIIQHPLIVQATACLAAKIGLPAENHNFWIPSTAVAEQLIRLSDTAPTIAEWEHHTLVSFPAEQTEEAKCFFSFMKHCGYMHFSRDAEDLLRGQGVDLPMIDETYYIGNGSDLVRSILTEGYGSSEITLTNCGMNAIYAAYAAIKETASAERDLFIQFGWLYTDSIHILRKCSKRFVQIARVTNLAELEALLESEGNRVAALLTETLSNPLIETADLPALRKLADRHGFHIILDNTFATPYNVTVAPYADIIVESLTKYAAGYGDCMAGAVIIPEGNAVSAAFRKAVATYTIPLNSRDLPRLAATIGDYRERMERVNKNCKAVVEYLQGREEIEALYHPFCESTGDNYRAIARSSEAYGGVISFIPKGDLAAFYDNFHLPKGPSLGCHFPLLMAYTMLAHWDLVTTDAGKVTMEEAGLSPKILRLSIGIDDPQRIIDAFDATFKATKRCG